MRICGEPMAPPHWITSRAARTVRVSQGRDEQEALENIKEAIVAWLWAEDQKAVAKMGNEQPVVVAI